MDDPQIPSDAGVDLGRLLGQRRAFAAVGGRCSAAHAQLLRRIRDEKLYRAVAPSWRRFCDAHLAITCRHAERLIALLNRFGPTYFEISQLVGLSPRQYLAIQPVRHEHSVLVNGEALRPLPPNRPQGLQPHAQPPPPGATPSPPPAGPPGGPASPPVTPAANPAAPSPANPLPRPCVPAPPISPAAAASSPTSSSLFTIPPAPSATANSFSNPPPNCASSSCNLGTDKTGMDFRRSLPEIRCQSCLSPPVARAPAHEGAYPFWGRWAEIRRKPGTDMNFRRSLPEIRCLSQGLPRGIRSRVRRVPKTVKRPRAWPRPSATCYKRDWHLESLSFFLNFGWRGRTAREVPPPGRSASF